MPAKGSKRKYPGRVNFLKKSLWQKYIKATGHDITWEEFFAIMDSTLKIMHEGVVNDKLGIRIPIGGYISVTRYGTPKNMIDLVYFSKTGKKKPLVNLHSLEDQYRIRWWRSGIATFRFNNTYKFEAAKKLKYAVRDAIYDGKQYEKLNEEVYMSDYVLERIMNKKLKKSNEHDQL